MTALEIGSRVLMARKLGIERGEGERLTEVEWRKAMPHVAAIYRALEAHGFELVSDTDRRAGLFDRPLLGAM